MKVSNSICRVCGIGFYVQPNRIIKGINKYCSQRCYGISKVGKKPPTYKKIEKKCELCSKLFLISPYRKATAQYCSNICRQKTHGEKIKREKCHLWKGGISFIGQMARMTPEYKRWRIEVFKRDNYTCQICGSVGKELNANHIKKFSEFVDSRFNVDNGITLCKRCHTVLVNRKESEWESYFIFNLSVRFLCV